MHWTRKHVVAVVIASCLASCYRGPNAAVRSYHIDQAMAISEFARALDGAQDDTEVIAATRRFAERMGEFEQRRQSLLVRYPDIDEWAAPTSAPEDVSSSSQTLLEALAAFEKPEMKLLKLSEENVAIRSAMEEMQTEHQDYLERIRETIRRVQADVAEKKREAERAERAKAEEAARIEAAAAAERARAETPLPAPASLEANPQGPTGAPPNPSQATCAPENVSIRFKRGSFCWDYTGRATSFSGQFGAGQTIEVQMKVSLDDGTLTPLSGSATTPSGLNLDFSGTTTFDMPITEVLTVAQPDCTHHGRTVTAKICAR